MGVSVRHVHICQRNLEIPSTAPALRYISWGSVSTGEFAAKETVALVGSRRMRSIEERSDPGTYAGPYPGEVSDRTPSSWASIHPAQYAPQGIWAGSAGITLIGPAGALTLPEGCIVVNRHVHMSTADAIRFGGTDDLVELEVNGREVLGLPAMQVG